MHRYLFGILLLALFYGENIMALQLTSSAFKNGTTIPAQYGCHGADISPPLKWKNVPEKTQSFVLIMDDPDAPMGTWDHWILFNLPSTTLDLEENIKTLPAGTQVGKNSWPKVQYGGPCPPDKMHRYYFKLYALDTKLDLPSGVDKLTVEKAMEKHILEETVLMGTYPSRR
jgi:Raf kinase inhibitor-like YbhB/YbcL family protein